MDSEIGVHTCSLCRCLLNANFPIVESINSFEMHKAVIALGMICHNVLALKDSSYHNSEKINFAFLNEVYYYLSGEKELDELESVKK